MGDTRGLLESEMSIRFITNAKVCSSMSHLIGQPVMRFDLDHCTQLQTAGIGGASQTVLRDGQHRLMLAEMDIAA